MEKTKDIDVHIVAPPKHIFRYPTPSTEEILVAAGQKVWLTERIEYPKEGGILIHFKNLLYTKKGFPFTEAINAVNGAKAAAVSMFRPLALKELKWAWLGFAITSWKKKLKVLDTILVQYNRTACYCLEMTPLGAVYLKPERMLKSTYELEKFISEFLWAVFGFMEERKLLCMQTGQIIATMFEYDDAYHYRLMDAFENVYPSDFKHPQRAVKKIFDTIISREVDERTKSTFRDLRKVARLALLHPKIRKAWVAAAEHIDVMKFKPDKADKYHMLQRSNYNYMGLTDDEKHEEWKYIHAVHNVQLPQMMEIQ